MKKPRSIAREAATAILMLAGLGAGYAGPAAAEATCDCSCETFAKIQSGMREQGGGGTSPEMQQLSACYSECSQQWAQCNKTAEAEADTNKWDCDNPPNAPVERREWADACDIDLVRRNFGAPRDDLERFHGEYQGPEIGWVVSTLTASPTMAEMYPGISPYDEMSGYMMVYANRGDVAPYHLVSVSDTRFRYTTLTGGNKRIAEFEVDADGQATTLILDGERHVRVSEGTDAQGDATDTHGNNDDESVGDDVTEQATERVDKNIDDKVKDTIDDAFDSLFGD